VIVVCVSQAIRLTAIVIDTVYVAVAGVVAMVVVGFVVVFVLIVVGGTVKIRGELLGVEVGVVCRC